MARARRASARRQTWVALLRGINLGARNKVPMAGLRKLFSDLGVEDVTTYLQSGNVVFRTSTARTDLARAIEDELRRRLGLDLTVVLRTKAELAWVVASNPFVKRAADETKLHVTFLAEPPARGRLAALKKRRFEPDKFHVARNVVYLHCPLGYGRSKLSNAFFEKELGVAATTRNWRTVTAVAELAKA